MSLKISAFLGVFLFMTALSAAPAKSDMITARKLLLENKAACVLLNNEGEMIACESGRGISPLLNIYDKFKGDLKNCTVVDKVIGRATAAIAVCGKVRHVHAEIMSQGAVDMLKKHKISVTYTLRVPHILNRKKDGLCPMEETVLKIDDPVKALAALRIKLTELRKNTPAKQ